MKIQIKSDKIIVGESLYDGYVHVEDGKITDVNKTSQSADLYYDFTGLYVSPGFIDTHTHGGGGYPFADSDTESVIGGVNFHLKFGTTSIAPTVSASAFNTMRSSLINIIEAKKSGRAKANILGAHLEGPYLSKKQCGAQCPDYITPPKKEEYTPLIEEYGKYILRYTYAPEEDAGCEFATYLKEKGIVASAGHTDATYPVMLEALTAGCNSVTHLYSCTSTVTRNKGYRSAGVIESAYLMDDLYAEIIADGKHLPPELIKLVIKVKGTDKVVLCTDSLEAAGSDAKSGCCCGTDFIIEDGVAKLPSREAFAGSIATANRLIQVLTKDCGFDIPTSVKMLTETPARMVGIDKTKGKLEKGYDADIVVFDGDINIKSVFVNGKTV